MVDILKQVIEVILNTGRRSKVSFYIKDIFEFGLGSLFFSFGCIAIYKSGYFWTMLAKMEYWPVEEVSVLLGAGVGFILLGMFLIIDFIFSGKILRKYSTSRKVGICEMMIIVCIILSVLFSILGGISASRERSKDVEEWHKIGGIGAPLWD